MNYLAHLFLAQPTPDSHYGNLLGDFRRGVDINALPNPVLRGLKNHYLVDKFTDQHALVKQAKFIFSAEKQRFSGIAIDVLFDYFLIKHWQQFSSLDFATFKQQSYDLLQKRQPVMPARMKLVTRKIIEQDWFASYAHLDSIGSALDNISRRIRFNNQFSGSIEDIEKHYDELENIFLMFFPELMAHVTQANFESNLDANKQ